ncbi:type II secretion system protein GspL [Pseudomonas sp. J452]|uniref:type II secretion system protein GspL n=1 Tax=Pseudomonas sp. J452 TaxID=2898441 RepID=UPI0021ADE4EC|nr:type II secretion system protein GspL [Pseudomonas sp. J452]UUY10636.1 type II secretion system protein GspL [Pseudomonas sp. J452]
MDCLFLPAGSVNALDAECQVHWQPAVGECLQLSLAECAERVAGQPVALVLPIEVVSSFLVNLPTSKARWVRQALPFAVEEMLAEDVDLFHLALGEQLEDERHRVLAVRRDLLGQWLGQMKALAVNVAAIYVDADLLPREGTQVLLLGERGLLGGECESRLGFARDHWPQLQGLCDAPVLLDNLPMPYRLLAEGRTKATNMAQAEFARRSDNQAWQVWRPVTALLGLWLLLHMGFSLFQALHLERQGERYAESSVALYKELFPEDRRIVNLKAQFAEHLKAGAQSGSGFISLMDKAAASLAQSKSSISVAQADYSQSSGDLALQVQAKDFSEVEQLRQRLIAVGLTVQMGSASREEQGVTARVVLGGGL